MTTPPDQPAPFTARHDPPSPDSLIGQAPVMMRGGALVSHGVLLLAAAVSLLVAGRSVALSVVLSGLTVSVLLLVGQAMQMALVRRADLQAMAMSLMGFGLRAGALCGALVLWIQVADRYPVIRPWGVLVGAVSMSLGWVAGVLLTYRQLRVPVFDSPGTGGAVGDTREAASTLK